MGYVLLVLILIAVTDAQLDGLALVGREGEGDDRLLGHVEGGDVGALLKLLKVGGDGAAVALAGRGGITGFAGCTGLVLVTRGAGRTISRKPDHSDR